MQKTQAQFDSEALLTEVEAAAFLRLSIRTLQCWRCKGIGPAYVRAGRAVRYRQSDLVHWINANTVTMAEPAHRQRREAG